MNRFSLIVG